MRLCLRRRFPPLGLHKGILNFPLPPNSLDLHETQNNKMKMQWVAYDQVVCGSSDTVVIRRAVISQHNKVKNFSRTSAGPKQDSATRHHHPTAIKALHSKKIIKLGFLSLSLVFNRMFTISELKSKIVSCPLGKQSRTVGIQNLRTTHYTAEA